MFTRPPGHAEEYPLAAVTVPAAGVVMAGWLVQRVEVLAAADLYTLTGLAVHEYEYVSYSDSLAEMICRPFTPFGNRM